MYFLLKYAMLILAIVGKIDAANILGVFMMGSYSHFTLGNRYMRELALRGHEVVYISPYKDKNPPKRYRDVTLETVNIKMEEFKKEMNMFEMQFMPKVLIPILFASMSSQLTEDVLRDPAFEQLLKSNATFDLIILESFFNEALRGLQYHYKCPVILSSSMGANPIINYAVMNPSPSSYIPNMNLAYSKRDMNFWMRLTNFLYNTLEYFILFGIQLPRQNELLQQYFQGAPHLYDLIYDNPIILMNSHITTFRPVPISQNMIDVGGYHIDPPKKLPDNLQKYLDNAQEGVVLFSMGSALKSAEMGEEKRNVFLKAFEKLKLKVLWKWENDTLPGQPNNVKLEKWLPQQDILPHPNIKLFITHGGLLSTTEAIYHGVPILGIPIFGDQQVNMGLAEVGGYGKIVSYGELSEEKLLAAITEVLSNPRYKESAKRRQKLLHDRPMSPMDTAMWWIEYVLRNPESDFHRSAGIDLKWYQLFLIDVIVFLGFVTFIVIGAFVFIVKKTFFGRKTTNKVNPKKKTN